MSGGEGGGEIVEGARNEVDAHTRDNIKGVVAFELGQFT